MGLNISHVVNFIFFVGLSPKGRFNNELNMLRCLFHIYVIDVSKCTLRI